MYNDFLFLCSSMKNLVWNQMKSKAIFYISILVFTNTITNQIPFAQSEPAPPSINAIPLPVGSGARALGMGGAFIAVADDATAASWNPGGLTQLERPELSVVGSFLSTQQDFFTDNPNVQFADESAVSRGDLNYVSVAYPFRLFGKNLVAALNYKQVYDFHVNLDYTVTTDYKDHPQHDVEKSDFESKGGVGALTPAISLQVTPKLSLGMAVNVYTDEFFGNYAWKQITHGTRNGTIGGRDYSSTSIDERTFKNFQAVNVTTGLLWNVWEKERKSLTFGAVYNTPYTANVDRIIDFQSFSSDASNLDKPFHDRRHFKVDYPMSFGAGFNFRCNDALSFSADVTWTDWSEFKQKDNEGIKSRPIGEASVQRDISDTYTVRYGTEYLLFRKSEVIPLRGGLFYEPRPSLNSPTDVFGFSVGSGITFQRFSIDGAYQFRWSNDGEGEDFGKLLQKPQFDLNEHLFLASIIVYF